MPPFGGILEPGQIENIHQYIIQRSHDWREELLITNTVKENQAP